MGTDGNGRSVTYGGMGGQSPGAAGAPGQSATFVPDPNTGGAGGGGGAHGAVVTTTTSNSVTITGGAGGVGGSGAVGNVSTASGGGGGGGYGTVVNASVSFTNSGTVAGGVGGNGGADTEQNGGPGGNGGHGGYGVSATFAGATVNNGGSIAGGAGGNGGSTTSQGRGSGGNGAAGIFGNSVVINNLGSIAGGTGGAVGTGAAGLVTPTPGTGGVGILGSNLTVINTGSIVGGVGGNGTAQVNAITFTGGANFLTLMGGWSISGNIEVANGSVGFNPLAALTVGNTITGTGSVIQIGPGSLALAGANTYTGATTVNAGTLALTGSGTIASSSGVNLAGAGAVLDISASSGNQTIQDLSGISGTTVNLGANRLVVSTAGASTFSGTIAGAGGLTMAGTGILTLAGANTYEGGTTINGGTLSIASDANLGSMSNLLLGLNGGTLETTASMATGRSIVLGGGGGTFSPDAGTTLTLNGAIDGTGGLTMAGRGTLVFAQGGTFNNFSGGITVNAGTLSASSSNLGLGGLTLNGGTLKSTDTFGIGLATTLGSNGGTFSPNSGTTLTLNGPIGGAGGLTMAGAGMLVLTGANTYGGGTTLNSGTLSISSDNSLGAAGGGLTFNGGTLQTTGNFPTDRPITLNAGGGTIMPASGTTLTFWKPVTGTGGLTMAGSGTLELAGANTYTGATTIASGTLALSGAGSLAQSSGVGLTAAGTTFDISGAGANQTIQSLSGVTGTTVNLGGRNLTIDGAASTTFSGAIGGDGGLIKQGAGTLTLAGTNTYGGSTSIAGGTLSISTDASLGGPLSFLQLNGGTLQSTASLSSSRSVVLGSGGGAFSAALGTTLTLNGTIGGGGGLTTTGAGTVALAGTTAYTGATTINAGTLALTGGGTIERSSGVNLAGAGAVFDISASNGNQTIRDLAGISGTTVNLGTNSLVVGTAGTSTFSGTIGGFGRLTMAGAGTLTLTGGNTYSGGATVTAGTLSISSQTSLGLTSGGLTLDGGTLQTTTNMNIGHSVTLGAGGGTFSPNAVLGVFGSVGGVGGLTMAGPGVLALAGINTYGGGTTVNSGTLWITSDANLGSASGGLTLDNGTLQTTASFASARSITLGNGGGIFSPRAGTQLTLNGVIDGASGFGLGMAGPGTLALGGANTYGGWTGIGAGTLALVGSGSIAQSAGVLLQGPSGSFDISGSSGNQTIQNLIGVAGTTINLGANSLALGTASLSNFAGVIQGSGGLIKQGSGTLMLSGQNTYSGGTTVNAGTLSISSDGNLGNTGGTLSLDGGTLQGTAKLTSARTIMLGGGGGTISPDAGTTLTLTGPVGGAGGLTMAGGGTLALKGANTYAGGTGVTAGALMLENGSLASGVTVNAGGTFGGMGSVSGNVTNSGTMALVTGGRMDVAGTYTNNAGSTYQVEVTPSKTSQLNVNGNAVLNGGTVAVMAGNGNYTRGPAYNILTASAGVTGTFAGVTSNLAFLTPSLSYDADNVYLTLLQSSNAFSKGARTANHSAVAAALDKANNNVSGDFATVLDAIVQLDTQQGPAALNAISGQSYANLGTFNTQTAGAFMSAVGAQLNALHGGQGRGGTYVAMASPVDDACIVTCDVAPEPSRMGAWLSGVGGLGSVLGSANAGTMTYNFGGAAVGMDYRVRPDLLMGIGVGYIGGTQWVSGFNGQANTDGVSASLYASYTPGNFYVDGLAGYGYANNRMTRVIAIPGLSARTAQGTTAANQFLGQVETGWRFDVPLSQPASVTPFVRLQGSTTTQNGFTESGADSLNLVVQQQTVNSLRSTIGVELAAAWQKTTLGLRLGWQHEFADTSRPMTASFSGAPGTPFTVFGATPQRDSAVLGLGATFQVADATEVTLRYDGEVGGGTNNNALTAGLKMKW